MIYGGRVDRHRRSGKLEREYRRARDVKSSRCVSSGVLRLRNAKESTGKAKSLESEERE